MGDWIEYGKTWREFQNEPSCKPGVVIDVGGTKHMIGSINELGGVCDCCREMCSSDVVTKYKVVWSEENG